MTARAEVVALGRRMVRNRAKIGKSSVSPWMKADIENHDSFIFIGKVLPQGKVLSQDNYEREEYFLHINDLSERATEQLDIDGLPLYYNHISQLKMGTIINSFYENGERYIIGLIDMTSDEFNRFLVGQIVSGKLLG